MPSARGGRDRPVRRAARLGVVSSPSIDGDEGRLPTTAAKSAQQARSATAAISTLRSRWCGLRVGRGNELQPHWDRACDPTAPAARSTRGRDRRGDGHVEPTSALRECGSRRRAQSPLQPSNETMLTASRARSSPGARHGEPGSIDWFSVVFTYGELLVRVVARANVGTASRSDDLRWEE